MADPEQIRKNFQDLAAALKRREESLRPSPEHLEAVRLRLRAKLGLGRRYRVERAIERAKRPGLWEP